MTRKAYLNWVEHFAKHAEDCEVATPAEGELADIVVCRLVTDPLMLPDNLVASCSKCFRMVQFRPHCPKRPAKVCDECAGKLLRKHKGNRLMITENTAADVAAFMRKKSLS